MSLSDISNTSSVRANLTALTSTETLLEQTEQQLATGKSVNSPEDNASIYYAAQTFLQQANDLASLKDNLSSSLTTVTSATNSISSATQVVQQLQGIVAQATSTSDQATRATLASQFNALLPQLDQLVDDSSLNGTNLLNGSSNNLVVSFNANNTAGLTISSVNITSSGLGIGAASNGFATASDLDAANSQLQAALSTLNTDAASFGNDATVIQTNQDFTSGFINNLQNASDNLTVADTNEEGANLLAQQAQDQLGVVSLGISDQLAQGILKLFG